MALLALLAVAPPDDAERFMVTNGVKEPEVALEKPTGVELLSTYTTHAKGEGTRGCVQGVQRG